MTHITIVIYLVYLLKETKKLYFLEPASIYPGWGWGWGEDSHIKQTGKPVRNFELNPPKETNRDVAQAFTDLYKQIVKWLKIYVFVSLSIVCVQPGPCQEHPKGYQISEIYIITSPPTPSETTSIPVGLIRESPVGYLAHLLKKDTYNKKVQS